MDSGTVTAVLVLLGTVVGAVAGIFGAVMAAKIASQNDRRRIAVEAALREWEQATEYARTHGGRVYPPALYVYYNVELLKLLDENRLTTETYAELISGKDRFRATIEADTDRREAEMRAAAAAPGPAGPV